jgi:hypothetical protein
MREATDHSFYRQYRAMKVMLHDDAQCNNALQAH